MATLLGVSWPDVNIHHPAESFRINGLHGPVMATIAGMPTQLANSGVCDDAGDPVRPTRGPIER